MIHSENSSNIDSEAILDSIDSSWFKEIVDDVHRTIMKRFYQESKIEVLQEDTLFGASSKAYNTMEAYRLSDYITLADFLLEPTGESMYESNSSLTWITLEDEIKIFVHNASELKIKEIIGNSYNKELLYPLERKIVLSLEKEMPFFIFLARYKTLPQKKELLDEFDLFENPF